MEITLQGALKNKDECEVHRNWSDLAIHHIKRNLCLSIAVCRDCGFVLRSVPYEEEVNA